MRADLIAIATKVKHVPCDGTGWMPDPDPEQRRRNGSRVPCRDCNRTGRVDGWLTLEELRALLAAPPAGKEGSDG